MPHPSDKPLDPLRQAHEEEYFHQQNAKLIEQLRSRLQTAPAAEELKASTGVDDDALLEELARLGVTTETLPLVHLAPLIEVAWADGEVQDEERELLMAAAAEAGVTEGSEAATKLDALLRKEPPMEFYEASLSLKRAILAALPADVAEAARADLQALALQVADATGGWFGVLGRVESSERRALTHIAKRLADARPDAAGAALAKLKGQD